MTNLTFKDLELAVNNGYCTVFVYMVDMQEGSWERDSTLNIYFRRS